MFNLLLATTAFQNECIYGATQKVSFAHSWIAVNILVIMLVFLISGLIYALSNVLPTAWRERFKGGIKTEITQAFLSIVIIMILVVAAAGWCTLGVNLTAQSVNIGDPMRFSLFYISNLMFDTGLKIWSTIFSQSASMVLAGQIFDRLSTINVGFQFLFSGIASVFFGYSQAITFAFSSLIALTFGILYLVWILLQLTSLTALSVVVPLAILMRSLPFMGPRLRESADTILALAIAFYFIFPLTIVLDNSVLVWLFNPCTPLHPNAWCDPYTKYIGGYQIANLPVDSLFTSVTSAKGLGGYIGIPFYSGFIGGSGGSGAAIINLANDITGLPGVLISLGDRTAQYMFQGVVLLAIDIGITVGFAQGLSKGLNSISRILGVGPVW